MLVSGKQSPKKKKKGLKGAIYQGAITVYMCAYLWSYKHMLCNNRISKYMNTVRTKREKWRNPQ